MIDAPKPLPLDPDPQGLRLARPLVLVGLMGAGKTSVGKRLAAMLDAPFMDSDHEVEAAAGMSVADIFGTLGEAAFRDGERRVIARLLTGRPGVLATGGGAFVDARTRAEIAACAVSVWLRVDLDLLWSRVRDRPGRPLLQAADPRSVLADLERRRAPLYAEADVTIDSRRGAGHAATAEAIVAALRSRDAARVGPPLFELAA